MVSAALQLDDFRSAAAPLLRDLGHSPEIGEEGIDRAGETNRLIAGSKFSPDKTALEAIIRRLLDEQHDIFHATPLPAPNPTRQVGIDARPVPLVHSVNDLSKINSPVPPVPAKGFARGRKSQSPPILSEALE